MADYLNTGNRWTAVYLVQRERGDILTYRKLPWEIVRFNVDVNPSAPEEIVPTGEDSSLGYGTGATAVKDPESKIYEKIWIVDHLPFNDKTSFGRPE
jgi:hypothetical protein